MLQAAGLSQCVFIYFVCGNTEEQRGRERDPKPQPIGNKIEEEREKTEEKQLTTTASATEMRTNADYSTKSF